MVPRNRTALPLWGQNAVFIIAIIIVLSTNGTAVLKSSSLSTQPGVHVKKNSDTLQFFSRPRQRRVYAKTKQNTVMKTRHFPVKSSPIYHTPLGLFSILTTRSGTHQTY